MRAGGQRENGRDQIGRDVSRHGDDSYGSRSGVMTEWMSHDGYGVEGQDVCSPASHQARCGVAFDMGHLWPAGHKWAQGSSHDDKWVWTGCYAGAVPAGRAGRCQCCFLRTACSRGVLAFGAAGWRTLRPLRGRRGGTRLPRRQSGLATLSVFSTPDRLHSNERGRRHCGVDLRVAPASGERADEQGPHSVRRLTRADSTVRLPIRMVQ